MHFMKFYDNGLYFEYKVNKIVLLVIISIPQLLHSRPYIYKIDKIQNFATSKYLEVNNLVDSTKSK